MRLDVRIFCVKNHFRALYADILGEIHILAAAVITSFVAAGAMRGIALAVLVCKAGAHSLHNVLADEILAGDKLDGPGLAFFFLLDQFKYSGCHVFFSFSLLLPSSAYP